MMCPSFLILILNVVHGLHLNPAEDEKDPDYFESDPRNPWPKVPQSEVTYTSPDTNQDLQLIPHSLRKGLSFIKLPKVGGSTWAGVMRRIGHRHGLNHAYDANWLVRAKENAEASSASVWANHGNRKWVEIYLQKVMPDPFYVTIIRHPTQTAMSHFYYEQNDPTKINDANKIDYLQRRSPHKFVDGLVRPQFWQTNQGEVNTATILASYEFVAVMERFDECLLIFGKMVKLPVSDLLYMKSKDSHADENLVRHPTFDKESQAVRDAALHLQTGEDAELYSMVNKVLDDAIVKYGASFQHDLERFQTMLRDLADICPPAHLEIDCLWSDNGCSQGCIDDYVSNTSMTGFFQ